MITGEYWIDDSGNIIGADGNMDATDHYDYAFVTMLAVDYDHDIDSIDFDRVQIEEDMERFAIANADKGRYEGMDELMVLEDAFGGNDESARVVMGFMDARDYAMKNWGWIRIAGNNIQVWQLTKSDLDRIAEAIEELDPDIEDSEEFWIEVMNPHARKQYRGVPWYIIDEGKVTNLTEFRQVACNPNQYQTLTNLWITPDEVINVDRFSDETHTMVALEHRPELSDMVDDDFESAELFDYLINKEKWIRWSEGSLDVPSLTKQNLERAADAIDTFDWGIRLEDCINILDYATGSYYQGVPFELVLLGDVKGVKAYALK